MKRCILLITLCGAALSASLPIAAKALFGLALLTTLTTRAPAAVTNVAWYRLGENDPGAASGLGVTSATTDRVGANHLRPFGGPLYTGAVSADAASRLGSTLAVQFNGASQFLSNALVSAARDNFGLEAWVKPNSTSGASTPIAYNGAGGNGWGLFQSGSRFSAVFGGVTVFDLGPVSIGTWTHLALVRDGGTNKLYFNGAAVGTSTTAPNAPTVGFELGARVQPVFVEFFNGAIDEVRVFHFAAGQFSTNDLLVNVRRVTTLPATGVGPTNATLNGSIHPVGFPTSAWFEWGNTTNYGNVTPPQALGSSGSTNFSEVLTGLISGVAHHFRAVASNSFGLVSGADQSFPNFAQQAYLKASNAQGADQFGFSVAASGDIVVIGAIGEESTGTAENAGAAYVFVRNGDSWSQQAFLKASNADGADTFGWSVAVSGDTIVIGAGADNPNFGGEDSDATGVNGDGSNNNATNSGAAYIFVRNGTNWIQQAYLKASNTGVEDRFGSSVAISGDTVVVGAAFEDSNATGINGNQSDNSQTNSGAAYVFVRSGTNWTQQAYLKASNTEQDDRFGVSVAVSGDTVVVGAERERSNATGVNGDQNNNGAGGSGAAYVFVRNGTTWTQQAYLKASNTGVGDEFGGSVAIGDDTVVVGARSEDSNATGVNGNQTDNSAISSGAAYVFARSGNSWTQQAYLKASNTERDDLFGDSVAVSGDTVVVGAFAEDSNATGINGNSGNNSANLSGAAYVFVRTGTSWSFQDYVKASNTDPSDIFGISVAVWGDIVVIGASRESSNATGVNGDQSNNSADSAGAAYVFGPPLPPFVEIAVEQSGITILDGGSSQQFVAVGTNTANGVFLVKSVGNGVLTGLAITIDGPDASMFTVTANPTAPVAPGSNTTFTVRFAPTSTGTKTATLHLANNDPDKNPFDILLNGLSLSFTEDRDGDGLNDASEFLMSPLGFDFRGRQTSLVNLLFNNAPGAGLFTQAQLQALNVDTPLLAKEPNTGLFKLTIGVEKATQLTNFFPFPMTVPQTSINAEGKLEFQFSAPDNAAFFRLEAR
jgi:hypothetical protein